MSFANDPPSRERLFWHLVWWELRRLALPLAGWLIVSLTASLLVHLADWSWPENQDEVLRQIRREKQTPVEAGMALAAAVVVYLTGELFIPLRPGAVRSRFAFPPCRQDVLVAAFLIQTVLVIVPFVLYYQGWVMVKGWDWEWNKFVRQFMPPVPVFAWGLALVAMLTGDWGIYLLVSTGATLGLWWYDPVACRHLALPTGLLIGIVSLAAAFAAAHWRHRWAILAAWVPYVALLMKL